MVGYSTSCCESGIVSRPSAGASLGAGSELSDVRPIGTRHKETSRRVSRSSSRFTSASTNPSTISASGLPAEIVLGFVDAEVNRLLDLDTRREVSLCLVPIGRTSESSLPAPREAPALGLETIPLSQHEVEYPTMLEMHDASSLDSVKEVNQWRGKPPVLSSSALAGDAVPLPRLPEEEQPKDTIEQVIIRRGSTRTFDKAASITLAQLSTILDYATRGLPADFLEPPGAQLNDLYLIVHSVQGLKSGAYFFGREHNTLELLKEGEFRAEAHHLGLEQELPADACA